MVGDTPEGVWKVTLDQISAGDITSGELSLPAELTFDVEGQDPVVIVTTLEGVVSVESGGVIERYRHGDVYVGHNPGAHWCAHTRVLHARMHTMSAALLSRVAATSPELVPAVEFLSRRPTAGGVQRWRLVSRLLDDLLADPEVARAPLVIGPATRLLAATALTAFPNTAMTMPTRIDRQDGHPETLRRAIAFIDSNPELDISASDIAGAAHVSTRAVQLAFRRHIDTTPMAYLRRVRLRHAHDQLMAATSQDGLTVTDVAMQWGFANPSRFSQYYRAAYGRPPSWTLRR
jgi:AraC-like DNA-binding protein